jgi:heat shock protein HslJ
MHGFRIGTITTAAFAVVLLFAGCASSAPGDASSTTPSSESSGAGSADAVGIVGVWGTEDQGKPSLTFGEDGALSGTDGCNRLVGKWTADAGTVEFGPLASTRMACEGVDTWLSDGVSGTYTDAELTVLDSTGKTIGTLERSN